MELLDGESAADTDAGFDAGTGMELGSDMAPIPTRLARVFFFFITPFLATPIGAKETPVPELNELKAAGAGASITEDEVEAVSEMVAGEDRAMGGVAVSVAGIDMSKLKALEGDRAAAGDDSAGGGCGVSSTASSVVAAVAVASVGDGIKKEKADPAGSASGAAAAAGSEVIASTGAAAVISVKKENPLLAAGAGGSADAGAGSGAAAVFKKEKDDGAVSGTGAEAPPLRKEKALLGAPVGAGAGAGASPFSSFPPLISSPPNMMMVMINIQRKM